MWSVKQRVSDMLGIYGPSAKLCIHFLSPRLERRTTSGKSFTTMSEITDVLTGLPDASHECKSASKARHEDVFETAK